MSKISTVKKVLQIKDHRKEEIELEVRNVSNMINMAQNELNSLERQFAEATDIFNERQSKRDMDINETGLFYNYFMQLTEGMNNRKKEIQKRLEELDLRRNELIEAFKETKLLEILKGKMIKEDNREKDISAQKEMDFMFLSRRKNR